MADMSSSARSVSRFFFIVLALGISQTLMAVLYHPYFTCGYGFPFHKRTSDMRDPSEDLNRNLGAKDSLVARIDDINARFENLSSFAMELKNTIAALDEDDGNDDDDYLYKEEKEGQRTTSAEMDKIRQRRKGQ